MRPRWMTIQGVRAETGVKPGSAHPSKLEQARGAQARNWISHRQRFPLEEPAGHRETKCRVADVNKLHKHPQGRSFLATGESTNLPSTYPELTGRSMTQRCHASAQR